jgi:isopentenyl-diphosphate delta-isomerase
MLHSNPQLFWQLGSLEGRVSGVSATALRLLIPVNHDFPTQVVNLQLQDKSFPPTPNISLSGSLQSVNDQGEGLFALKDARSEQALGNFLGRLRKQHHIDLCRDGDVETEEKHYGFAELSFIPNPLPELDWEDISCEARFLGRSFAAPLLISGMTGGIAQGEEINRRLAAAAATIGIPMGVGSQRIACEQGRHAEIFAMKKRYPSLCLLGNLGCAQIIGPQGFDLAMRAVDMIEADALVVHLNVVQECLQVEGSRSFKGVLARLAELSSCLPVPVIVKEVGCGISPQAAERLLNCGIAALDIAGKGGTSWGYIEGLRSSDPEHLRLAESFRNWGIPTAYSLDALHRKFPAAVLIASGGVRDGATVAKAMGLGATMVGLALPLFQAALISEEEVIKVLGKIIEGLKITMMATASKTPPELGKALSLSQPLRQEFLAAWKK